MNFNVRYIEYKNFGKCLAVDNGHIELYIMLDFGPRIIRFARANSDENANMFFENGDRTVFHNDAKMDSAYGENSNWYIYGGHRLWISPEYSPETYYPDNDPVQHFISDSNVIRLVPPVQRVNNLQFEIEIEFTADDDVKLTHKCTNCGDAVKNFSLWALSVMAPQTYEILPMPSNDMEFLWNRRMMLWPYTDMGDSRVHWGKKYIGLQQDPNAVCPFKIGINYTGVVYAFNHGNMFVKRTTVYENAVYPDCNVAFETYTNSNFLELETLSPLFDAAPNNTVAHTEHWSLKGNIALPDIKNEPLLDKFFS